MRVLFPTLGGPTTATTMGGGSKGIQSTTSKWSFLVCKFSEHLTDRGTRTLDQNVKLCIYVCMSDAALMDRVHEGHLAKPVHVSFVYPPAYTYCVNSIQFILLVTLLTNVFF